MADFIGLDTCLAILEVLQAELGEKYRPCPLLQKMVAGESAKLGQPEVNLGIIPGFGGTQRLSRLVGVGKAKEMIFTGEIIDAKETESIGLVNRAEKDEELMAKVEEMAQVIAQKAPVAVKMVKALINENQEPQINGGTGSPIRRLLSSEKNSP
ncbi:MAG: enoyl-CoA hydratase-related protein [Candidatus Brocadiaceae bacterium]|nr:enoyl-CoA hydratase-related protein [Candidatus Brocadiaceae bacterium]